MKISFYQSIKALGVALLFFTSTSIFAADGSVKEIIEARQETQILTTYALSPYLRSNDLKVVVHDGKATLSGFVDEDINRELAKEIALGVSGIKEVDNQILVNADYVVPKPSASRSFGEIIDDASVTAAVKSKLLWSKHTNGFAVKVDTKYGRVTLSGTAETNEGRDLAGRLAMSTRGVVSVNNQVVVGPTKSPTVEKTKEAVNESGKAIADAWITTKVKTTLLYSSNVVGADVDVSTVNGVVTLKGKLSSGVERALAIELAQNVRGVRSVEASNLIY